MSDDLPLPCELCGRGHATVADLDAHMAEAHGIDPDGAE